MRLVYYCSMVIKMSSSCVVVLCHLFCMFFVMRGLFILFLHAAFQYAAYIYATTSQATVMESYWDIKSLMIIEYWTKPN